MRVHARLSRASCNELLPSRTIATKLVNGLEDSILKQKIPSLQGFVDDFCSVGKDMRDARHTKGILKQILTSCCLHVVVTIQLPDSISEPRWQQPCCIHCCKVCKDHLCPKVCCETSKRLRVRCQLVRAYFKPACKSTNAVALSSKEPLPNPMAAGTPFVTFDCSNHGGKQFCALCVVWTVREHRPSLSFAI